LSRSWFTDGGSCRLSSRFNEESIFNFGIALLLPKICGMLLVRW
jgi:hypothetical protein